MTGPRRGWTRYKEEDLVPLPPIIVRDTGVVVPVYRYVGPPLQSWEKSQDDWYRECDSDGTI